MGTSAETKSALEFAMSEHDDKDPALYQHLHRIKRQVRSARDTDNLIRVYVRTARELLKADAVCAVAPAPGGLAYRIRCTEPDDCAWDVEFLTGCATSERWPRLPDDLVLARLARRGRRGWGMLAMTTPGRPLPSGVGRQLQLIADELSEALERLDAARLDDVRARLDDKIIQQLPPKDLYYQLLDGLHQLTRYDHSAALWLHDGPTRLRLMAEQVQWRKAKSDRIATHVDLTRAMLDRLRPGDVYGLATANGGWREWTLGGVDSVGEALYPRRDTPAPGPEPASLLIAPLGNRERHLGVLAVAAQAASSLLEFERDVVQRLAPLASAAILRARDLHYVQEHMVNFERRQVLADLAAGVAHDINNQLGSLLPTVQSLRRDLLDGPVDATLLGEDLESIEESARACARTVRSMLQHARGARPDAGPAVLRISVDRVVALLGEGLERQHIRLGIDIPADLPAAAGPQGDLDRLIANLTLNARDAMLDGGRLQIAASAEGATVRLVVADSGHGIPLEDQPRIFEPFFTTKPSGTGLGLGVVRRVVDEFGGKITFRSAPGEGTRFDILLPVAT